VYEIETCKPRPSSNSKRRRSNRLQVMTSPEEGMRCKKSERAISDAHRRLLKSKKRKRIIKIKVRIKLKITGSAMDGTSGTSTIEITADKSFLDSVRKGYTSDAWCKTLPAAAVSWPDLTFRDGLWYVGNRLIIPRTDNIHEMLFILAHDVLGHFGFYKTYGSL